MAAVTVSRVTRASPSTRATSVARLTLAPLTPGRRFKTFSIRVAQAAQVMPLTPSERWVSELASSVLVIGFRWTFPSWEGQGLCGDGDGLAQPPLTFPWWQGPYSGQISSRITDM